MLGRFKKKDEETHLVAESSFEDIADSYDIDQGELGSGSFSIVKTARNKETGEDMAVKIIDKKNVVGKVEMLQTEVDILKRANHPNIIHLREVYEDSKRIYLVMELVTGGELFDQIVERGSYSERDAAKVMGEIFDALEYLHSINIVHRDLKPENLLCATSDPDSDVRLADFGLSKIVGDDTSLHTACGTPGYVAPEVLQQKGYTTAVDLWSAGVIMYILLCGFPPFYAEATRDLFDQIMNGDYSFPSPYWDGISEPAKDLISRLLVVDPSKRYTATEALDHEWIKGNTTPTHHIEGFTDRLSQYNARRKFKRAGLAVLAVSRMASLSSTTTADGAGAGPAAPAAESAE